MTPRPDVPCDNTSIGVIITDSQDRYLLIDRATAPFGMAPVAGHIDQHGGPEFAARNEVREEVGLTVVSLRQLSETWLPNSCRRPAGPEGIGHYWTLYQATFAGQIQMAADEVRAVQWADRTDLQTLAERAIANARIGFADQSVYEKPVLQSVWVLLLASQSLISASAADLAIFDLPH
ncbi:NUDIX hydrolase [Actinomadura sp. 3N508]|uniref:NUDIX hydrolase n=1 Tax=Actinomadura sp. 3N508 TaxID=3375153 RepID=UPI00378C4329